MNLNLKGKWVLVTGASSGLGRALCIELVRKYQANLIITARREERLQELKFELEKDSSSYIEAIKCDISDQQDIERLVLKASSDRTIYAAILNAGVTAMNLHEKLNEDEIKKMVDVNIMSTILLTNHLLAHFTKENNDGGILYISSLSAIYPTPYQAVYSGTKAFINNFVLAISQEYHAYNFSFSVFTPGGIKTEMTNDLKIKHLEKWLVSPEKSAQRALDGFIKRKLLFSSSLSLDILWSRFLPLKMKLLLLRKIYELPKTF